MMSQVIDGEQANKANSGTSIKEKDLLEFKPVVEVGKSMETSMMKSVYENVGRELKAIVDAQKKLSENEHTDSVLKKKTPEPNIIMLNGDRGSGKTSCMVSIVSELVEGKRGLRDYTCSHFKDINVDKFVNLELIDPSEFEDESNILHIVIGELFREFKQRVEKNDIRVNPNDKRLLLVNFEEVLDSIKVLSGGKSINGSSELDHLIGVADALKLSKKIETLIENYLRILYTNESSNNIKLIIPIDDMDLNSKHAYSMLEQIRKYFMVSNVIFIMASKVEQLKLDIKQSFGHDYKMALDKKMISNGELDSMTSKYVEKLIPVSRRISLPLFENLISLKMSIDGTDQNGSKKPESIEEYLLKRIYEKTRLYFGTGTYESSRIIPKNLREYGNIVKLIDHMDDANNKTKDVHQINRNKFTQYFLNTWIPTRLDSGSEKILNEVYNKSPEQLNKFIVGQIAKKYEISDKFSKDTVDIENASVDQKKSSRYRETEYYNVIEASNYARAVSFGDVIFAIQYAERFNNSEEDLDFIFAIKTLYSILLMDRFKRWENEKNDDQYRLMLNGLVKNVAMYPFFNNTVPLNYTSYLDYATSQGWIKLGNLKKVLEEINIDNTITQLTEWDSLKPSLSQKSELSEEIDFSDDAIRDLIISRELTINGGAHGSDQIELKDCGYVMYLIIIEMILTMVVDGSPLRLNEQKKYRIYAEHFSNDFKYDLKVGNAKNVLLSLTGHFANVFCTEIDKLPLNKRYTYKGGEESEESFFRKMSIVLGPLSLEKMLENSKRFYVGNVEIMESLYEMLSIKSSMKIEDKSWILALKEYLNALVTFSLDNNWKVFNMKDYPYLEVWKFVMNKLHDEEIEINRYDKNKISLKIAVNEILEDLRLVKYKTLLEETRKPVSVRSGSGFVRITKELKSIFNQLIKDNKNRYPDRMESKVELREISNEMDTFITFLNDDSNTLDIKALKERFIAIRKKISGFIESELSDD